MYGGKIGHILLGFLVVFTLVSCSSGGGQNDDKSATLESTIETMQKKPLAEIGDLRAFDEEIRTLENISINNTKEFADVYNQEDPLVFFLKLKEKNENLQAEDMRSLMKALEVETVLKPLKNEGKISDNALQSVKTINMPLMKLKSGLLREWKGAEGSELDSATQEKYIKQQLIEYNNILASYGKPQLGLEEFKQLKSAIKEAPVVFRDFGRALQNVDANGTDKSSSSPKRYLAPAIGSAYIDSGILNPINEHIGKIDTTPTKYLQFLPNQYAACKSVKGVYPFQIMGKVATEEEGNVSLVDTSLPLIGDKEDKRYFQINERGLVELLLTNRSALDTVTIDLEHKDKNLLQVQLSPGEKKKIYIPVRDADVCVPYYMTKNDADVDVFLLRVIEPQKMDELIDSSSGNYYLQKDFTITYEGEKFQNATVVEFMEKGVSQGKKKNIRFDDLESNIPLWYIIEAPSGKLYLGNAHRGGSKEIEVENGKWLVYLLPEGHNLIPYKLDANGSEIVGLSYLDQSDELYETMSYRITLPIDKKVNTKKFIVSEMESAEFSHDGETDGHSAEVTLKLHTNMAPKLDFGEEIEESYNEKPDLAYRCWFTHGKKINLFDTNGACNEYKDGLKSIFYEYFYTVNNIASDSGVLSDRELNTLVDGMPSSWKQDALVWYGGELRNRLQDKQFRMIYELYASIYEEWLNSVVQINNMRYPFGYHYGLRDSIQIGLTGNGGSPTPVYNSLHPKISMHIPILALTKERMAKTSLPFSFQYSAKDADEIDEWAQFAAMAKYAANQTLAAVTGNFAALVCNTVSAMQDLRQIEINAEDDPIGEADFFINRFSKDTSFYGLENATLDFAISGFAEIPNHYTSFDRNLQYAALVCGITGVVTSGYNLYSSASAMLDGDLFSSVALENLRADLLANLEEGSEEYTQMVEVLDSIENGTAGVDIITALAAAQKTSVFTSGVDLFNELDDVVSDIGGLGGEGHYIMRSQANYFFSDFDQRKTRAKIKVKEVEALPVKDLEVTLTNVKILNNYEDGDAEVKLRTRVGVISDQAPTYAGDFSTNAPFMVDGKLAYDNGSGDYKTLPNLPFKGYLLRSKDYNGIKDGENLPLEDGHLVLYDADYPTNNNMAAIYVEIGLFEGDGGGVDDDMIGVYSKTFYLEDIFNQAGGLRWERVGDRFRLYVSDFPVYNDYNLETSVEVLDKTNKERQLLHNQERLEHPSALLSFYIELHLGEFTDYPEVDISVDTLDGDPTHGKPAMDMSKINLKAISYLDGTSQIHLLDVYNDQILISDRMEGLRIASILPAHQLAWRASINPTGLPASQSDLIEIDSPRFKRDNPAQGSAFIDKNHILVFKGQQRNKTTNLKLAIVKIDENTQDVSVIATKPLPNGSAVLKTIRGEDGVLKAFIMVQDIQNDSGRIEIYNVTPSSIAFAGRYELLHIPIDMLDIDENNLLVKMADFKKENYAGGEYYYHKEVYLLMLRLNEEGNGLIATDTRQFSLSKVRGLLDMGLDTKEVYRSTMYNINRSKTNRIVYVDIRNRLGGESIRKIDLLYNDTTENYRIGSKRDSRLIDQLENPEYMYYLDQWLSAYNNDMYIHRSDSAAKIVAAKSENFTIGDKHVSFHAREKRFLDGRYLVINSNGFTLAIVDTLYIDNTPPQVSGDDFEKEHILEFANDYHKTLHFHIEDNESSVEDMNITFKIIDFETNATVFEGVNSEPTLLADRTNGNANFWFDSKVECSNDGNCSLDITYLDKGCISKKHIYELIVEDNDMLVVKKFSIWQAPTLPDIQSATAKAYRHDDGYTEVSASFSSETAGTGGSNGCVERFILKNTPSWIDRREIFDMQANKKSLTLRGTPPTSVTPGDYDITIHAVNARGEDIEHFIITVMPPDTTPESFVLHEFTDVNLSTIVRDSVTITGIQADTSISITNGEYSLDGGKTWTSADGSVANNTTVYVRHTSASEYASSVSTTLTVGGVSATMTSRTLPDPSIHDTTPDSFTFADKTDVELSQEVQAEITISGINEPTSITITGGEYSLDLGKTWTSADGVVNSGDTVIVRHTSASSYATTTDTVVTIGGVRDTFSSTTRAAQPPQIANSPIATVDKDSYYDYKPELATNSPAVESWSIDNKPDWANFDKTSGRLSGTPSVVGVYRDIVIYAINSEGNDSIRFSISVQDAPPYIDGGYHTLDENEIVMSFSDNENWRNAVTNVSIDDINLSAGSDYNLSSGRLVLYVNGSNNVPTTPGGWNIKIEASGYSDTIITPWVEAGQLDLDEARSSLIIENAPFGRGKRSTVKLHTVDRFGNDISMAQVEFALTVTNNDTTFIEPYKIKSVDGSYYLPMENNLTFESNITGSIAAYILIPACVDVGDGFTLSLKRSLDDALIDTLTFENNVSSCRDIDWNVRGDMPASYDRKLVVDNGGNLYVVGTTNETNSTTYDIHIAKYDRNGVLRWEKFYGGSGLDDFVDVLIGDDGMVYIAASSNNEFVNGNGLHIGGYDWVFAKIDPQDGSLVYAKQGGDGNDNKAVGITKGSSHVNLIVQNQDANGDDTNVTMLRFAQDGTLDDTIGLSENTSASMATFNSAYWQFVVESTNDNIEVYDENGTFIKEIMGESARYYIDANDSIFGYSISKTPKSGTYMYYGEATPTERKIPLVEKRSEIGNFLYSKLLDNNKSVLSDLYIARMDGALYVAHTDLYSIVQGNSVIDVASMYIDVLNQYDGNLSYTKSWESQTNTSEVMVRAFASDASTHSLYILSTVRPANHEYAGTDSSAGDTILTKTVTYDALPDNRSGMSRNDYYDIVNDYDHNLQWIDGSFGIELGPWSDQERHCFYFAHDSYNDGEWRFPTKEELLGIKDATNDPAMKSVFQYRENDYAYFTSEEVNATHIEGVFFWNGGGSDAFSKTQDRLYTRCVRTME